jgi:hypothetical protein
MKPIEIVERVATEYEDQTKEYTAESIREIFGDDPGCLVIHLLERLEAAESEIEQAREACGGFVNPPFDGSLSSAINVISIRCGAAEKELRRLREPSHD